MDPTAQICFLAGTPVEPWGLLAIAGFSSVNLRGGAK
jgi:hypothetical protein